MSYSAIKGSKVTLPSVEGGFGTLNILKDPPKSVYTSYKPKISDTSKLTELIDNSGDRICESIQKFARGVNPMVSVSYSNYGSNGGQSRGGDGAAVSGLHQGQSYLPHRIMRDGAFRPPIIPPEQLLPLSRLPRKNVDVYTNQGSDITLDFKEQTKCSTDLKALREELMKMYVLPTKTFNFETVAENPSELKATVQEKALTAQAFTNKHDSSIYTLGINPHIEKQVKPTLYGSISVNNSRNIQSQPNKVLIPEKGIKPIHQIPIHTKASDPSIQPVQSTPILPDRGIKDALQCSAYSNTSEHTRGTPVEQVLGNQPIRTQDVPTITYTTPKITHEEQKYIHSDKKLDRNTPLTSMSLNKFFSGVDLNDRIQSRDYTQLPARASRGGFSNDGFRPVF